MATTAAFAFCCGVIEIGNSTKCDLSSARTRWFVCQSVGEYLPGESEREGELAGGVLLKVTREYTRQGVEG